uniref:Uncharacterized protein n=1 Tax=Arundo donax TaxID=35708 RepID=A0A0A9GE17_ARUDO
MASFLWYELPCISDFVESQLKNLVKNCGSQPSETVNIGVSRERFSIRKSSTRKFSPISIACNFTMASTS